MEYIREFFRVNKDGVWFNYERLLVQNLVFEFYSNVPFVISYEYHKMAVTAVLYS
jgi:hypothetical protein